MNFWRPIIWDLIFEISTPITEIDCIWLHVVNNSNNKVCSDSNNAVSREFWKKKVLPRQRISCCEVIYMVISFPKIWNKNWFLFAILNDTKWLTIVDFHLEMLLYLHPHVSFFFVHVFVHCFSHTFSLSLEANNASFQATRGAEFHNLPSRYISSLLLAPATLLSYKLPIYGVHEL